MAEPARIKPPMGHDNAWWWELAAEGKLGIQRCTNCGKLRHPPRPMCDACQSEEWEPVISSGKGVLLSYTILTHPQFPGYEYPLIIILVELEEGTRLTSQLIDCEPDAVGFDLPVEMVMQEDPDGFKLPVFKLSESR